MKSRAFVISLMAFVVAVLQASPSMATCFSTNYKSEHGNKEQLIQAIMNYGQCVKAENKERVGKYFCHADSAVEILMNHENGQTLESGNQRPSVDTFYLTITEVDNDTKRVSCDYGELGVANNFIGEGNQCLANYHVEFSNGSSLGGVSYSTDGYSFYGAFSNFTLYGTNVFIWSTVGALSKIMKGRCEKVN